MPRGHGSGLHALDRSRPVDLLGGCLHLWTSLSCHEGSFASDTCESFNSCAAWTHKHDVKIAIVGVCNAETHVE